MKSIRSDRPAVTSEDLRFTRSHGSRAAGRVYALVRRARCSLAIARCAALARRLRRAGRLEPDAGDGRRHGCRSRAAVPDHPGLQAQGRPDRGQGGLHERRLRRLPHARRRARDRHGRPEPRPGEARLPARDRAGDASASGAMPSFKGQLTDQQIADVAAYVVEVDRRHGAVELPAGFPRARRRLRGRPRPDADRRGRASCGRARAPRSRASRAAGVHVIVVTGRMFRAVRPYLEQAGLDDPVVCYQGAVVADPATGEFLRHVPIPRAEALEAIDAVVDGRLPPQLLRRRRALRRRGDAGGARATPTSSASRSTRSAPLRDVARRRPDEARRRRRPGRARRARGRAEAALRRPALHLEVAAVLPRVRAPGREQGLAGSQFVADRLGFTAGGDGRVRRRRERPRAARLGRLRRRRRERARGRPRARRPRRARRRRTKASLRCSRPT